MFILLTLVTFLLLISISYFQSRRQETVTASELVLRQASPPVPQMVREDGFEIPKGYCFHPGHTWVLDEGRQNARIGLDSFAANLIGKIDRIEVAAPNRWVRQGRRIWRVTRNGLSVDMVSPIEGEVIAVNYNALQDPSIVTKDPYRDGWILVVKSPDIATNLNNLIQGAWVRTWMQNTLDRLGSLASQLGVPVAQDGGLPIAGLLARVESGLQRRMIREFFLT